MGTVLFRSAKLKQVAFVTLVLLSFLMTKAGAQSTDSVAPSPIRSNEVRGSIAARDIGDARLTDHYYALVGTPGDLLVTIETKNLNGDIDVFTSSGLRPLLKFTVYADISSPITKSVYFRKREDLIVRIEARTPNDDPGEYRLYFGGSFEPITSGPLLAENSNPSPDLSASAPPVKKGRRVTSTGARINEPEPPPEVAAATEPTENAESTPPRVTRKGRRGSTRTRAPSKSAETEAGVAKTNESAATTKPEEQPPAAKPVDGSEPKAEPAPKPSARRSSTRRGAVRRPKPEPEPIQEPEAESGPRLIIETTDGTLIDRFMSSVRRVTVENGQVVVVGKDGKINRIRLSSVIRMSIAP